MIREACHDAETLRVPENQAVPKIDFRWPEA
jgi:hypothetical protein